MGEDSAVPEAEEMDLITGLKIAPQRAADEGIAGVMHISAFDRGGVTRVHQPIIWNGCHWRPKDTHGSQAAVS